MPDREIIAHQPYEGMAFRFECETGDYVVVIIEVEDAVIHFKQTRGVQTLEEAEFCEWQHSGNFKLTSWKAWLKGDPVYLPGKFFLLSYQTRTPDWEV